MFSSIQHYNVIDLQSYPNYQSVLWSKTTNVYYGPGLPNCTVVQECQCVLLRLPVCNVVQDYQSIFWSRIIRLNFGLRFPVCTVV